MANLGKTPRPTPALKPPMSLRPTQGPLGLFDLEAEAKQLRLERAWQQHGQAAKTLVRHEHFRVVLIALRAGRRCQEHSAEESLSVQALDGDIRVHLARDEVVELRPGYLLALAPGRVHDLEGLEDSVLLLTMAWTGHHPEITGGHAA